MVTIFLVNRATELLWLVVASIHMAADDGIVPIRVLRIFLVPDVVALITLCGSQWRMEL
jgi:hypothetical protein